MINALALVLLVPLTLATVVLAYGAFRSRAVSRTLRTELAAARASIKYQAVDFRELDGLPAPVQRYFRLVLKNGQPMVTAAQVQHRGTFNMGQAGEQWKPFRSAQLVVVHRPGFDWDARISLWPGLTIRVHDAYIAGEGILHASMLGLLTVAHLRGGGQIAEGELMRFLAEAAWYPTALLPSQGVAWEAVSADSARATLIDGAVRVHMLFNFNENGVVDSVSANGRGRTVKGEIILTPWEGRFWNYRICDGMYVPQDGEALWIEADGAKPYWRGAATAISYEYA
jgi:hypothetical protein